LRFGIKNCKTKSLKKTSAHIQKMLYDVIWNTIKQSFIWETFPLTRVRKSSSKVQMNWSGFFNV
jgi:hypothetical protein